MPKTFTACGFVFIAVYAAEAPIRYWLKLTGLDSMIFARDGLLAVPLGLLLVKQSIAGRVQPAYWFFVGIVMLHGTISYLNFHSATPAVYGAKFLLPLLFGYIAAFGLTEPRGKLFALFCLVWFISTVALWVDKLGPDQLFPWSGMTTEIGDLTVNISNNWNITSGFDRRVAGLTRNSIDAAMLLPMLALIIAGRCNWLMRLLILVTTEVSLYFTTQKGALIVFALIIPVLCLPRYAWYKTLNGLCLIFLAVAVLLPLLTRGLLMETGGGIFSLASLGMRIGATWPDAFKWIAINEVFPFGTGLGGLGGAQRLFSPNSTNPADNIFVFMYGNFGVFGLVYLLWAACSGLFLPPYLHSRAHVPLCLIAQTIGYGVVLSILEGPLNMLLAGAAIGSLWKLRQLGGLRLEVIYGTATTLPYRGIHGVVSPRAKSH